MCWEIQERRRTSQHTHWHCWAMWWYCRELCTGRTWLEVGVQIGRTAHWRGLLSKVRVCRLSKSSRLCDDHSLSPHTFGLLSFSCIFIYLLFSFFSLLYKEKRHQKIKTSIKCPLIILVIFFILCSLKISCRNTIYLGCIDPMLFFQLPQDLNNANATVFCFVLLWVEYRHSFV